ncbi:hypothetical protein O1L55_07835 [Streptomyces albulus]|nr:hypothetical protein [Streptomyces noursei]
MTHAWLFTGPPGPAGPPPPGRSRPPCSASARTAPSGRPGCGFCDGCHTTLVGTHADVEIVRTDLLSIGVKETRELVRRASLSPAGGRWQVIVLEDADRLTEGAGNVLLKAVEEPAPRTVWLLCAPPSRTSCPPSARAAATSRCARPRSGRSPRSSSGATASTRRRPTVRPAPPRATSTGPAGWPPTSGPGPAGRPS